MMNWKDIPGYEGLYQVSDCGQVRSLPRKGAKERILKPYLNKFGYHKVGLFKDGKVKNHRVHRIVALAFLEGDHSLTVNHKDECKTNNHVLNLEYMTSGDNTREWIKNNTERFSNKQGGHKVLDTQTGKTFPSIRAASRYMHEEEGAKGPKVWGHKIRLGKQDRFQIIIN